MNPELAALIRQWATRYEIIPTEEEMLDLLDSLSRSRYRLYKERDGPIPNNRIERQ